MPKYDYLCESNGRVVEVSHSMNDRLQTWGEVCERANIPLDDIPANSPVAKLITGGGIVSSRVLKNPEAPPCRTGAPCCGTQRCDFA